MTALTLGELAQSLKSANAGASLITFDVFFATAEDLERARPAISQALIAELYSVRPDDVQVFVLPAFLAMKVTIPRLTMFGSIDERDFDGVQQHAALLAVTL